VHTDDVVYSTQIPVNS